MDGELPAPEKLRNILSEPAQPPPTGPMILKNDIAILDPDPIAKGAFGQVYLGKVLNPVALLAERIVWGEEDPRWLGLPSEEPRPIEDPAQRERVHEAARRLWREYLERRRKEGAKANEEYQSLLGLIDPMLIEDRQIAVKVVRPVSRKRPTDTSVTREIVRRFIKENDILRRLRHPNIVRRFGLVLDPQLGWCMLLEYVDGETLDTHMNRHPDRRIPLPAAARMTQELVSALEYTQSKGLVHRDLKPQNVMIRADDGRVTLMDFGIGKWIDDSESRPLTTAGCRIGTPRFMAPEQVRQGGEVTRATDVYQLSTVLFEMVTGHAAYDQSDMASVFAALCDENTGHPSRVRDFLPDVPPEMECLIEVGRDKDPERRWTIREFREKLDRILARELFAPEIRRAPESAEEIEKGLLEARVRKKECQWEERSLEARLQEAALRARLGEVRQLLARGAIDEARAVAGTLTTSDAATRRELALLGLELERAAARREIEHLLEAAECSFVDRRFLEVGALLDRVRDRLPALPPERASDLQDRYRTLHETYEANHRSFVDLFQTLRHSLIGKIAERTRELSRGAGSPDSATELLQEVELAENTLGTLDPEKVGPADYDAARAELRRQRALVESLTQHAA